jgi:hypothetical protein
MAELRVSQLEADRERVAFEFQAREDNLQRQYKSLQVPCSYLP